MALLKKLKRKTGLTVGKITDLFVKVDQMKQNRLLETTSFGYFKIFPEILQAATNKETFCKNLYIYARNTGLIKEGESLDLVDIDPEKDTTLATITGDTVHLL